MDDDPYVYPGTRVLKNLLGIHDAQELSNVEYDLTWMRRQQLELNPIQGDFDLQHLQAIHHHLFQDLFAWAGQLRTVVISKGSSVFYASDDFATAGAYTFNYLREASLLSPGNMSDDVYVEGMAEFISRLNYLHPFREGNGRANRAFIDQVAALSGRTMSWRNVGKDENLRASIRSVNEGTGEAFVPMLRLVIAPPLDGLSPFDGTAVPVSS